ncbi:MULTISPECIES: aminofutalosine synthase MqnE [unclassified Mucilaginibacter]|uniref:aminofutalosine synthase MqnE n=1 Tax=unclassified Mucilaginibacter TaxID=2617802 RepID=UPI00095C2374|nr:MULTISPECIES: aminofutalosine synthase MqnE [unclassified Mucilaginibacter]HEK19261.1 aminofutalosine synthase MqnE [Bacteroidota bacterium]OJW18449.1 MAG: aminofutalosine synthase MqnE [Mucilaginibacter sp. 44-25]PAW94065.1 aminofutalosine synthase MqnE [Mucilaginibacter sp. MD40]PLW89887.1 MAG: aminofutalosine synthase MqnE [Mucilaginibacter sp.]PMP65591.1 MAG: aminofutalosine synthase MqnE [Mucilaginibacter sp.]
MEVSENLRVLINDPQLLPELKDIAGKVLHQQRITFEEGVLLYEKAELGYLGVLANYIREQKHGDKTYFNRNFHIEPTNLCVYDCKFCSYSRLIKQRADGWEYTMDEMMDIVKKYDDQPVTEVHIVGGVLPQYDVPFYSELFSRIKAHRPELHVKALTPVEYHYIFKKAKIDYATGMKMMKDAGLESIPGGGAEIFHPEVRDLIAKDKCTGDQWLAIHEEWHKLGMRSNATMLYGHIEQYWHRVDHMERLRQLQDRTGGFQTFIPLKFRNQDNQMSNVPESTVIEDLRNYAIARIYLDNFDHIKAYWAMISRTTAQLSLNFGVDDIDGTLDDTTKIYSMAGAEEQHPAMSTKELVELIKNVGRHPIERDTLYNVVTDYKDYQFEETAKPSYYKLPVIN